MKCILIGGNGFIGGHLSRYLRDEGHDVVNVDKVFCQSDFKQYVIDGSQEATLLRIILAEKPDWIVNLAARTDPNGKNLADYSINLEITRSILYAADRVKFKLLHVSTQYVLGPTIGKPGSVQNSYNLYGESKLLCENLVRSSSVLNWIIVRPTNVWGPGHPHFASGIWKQIEKGFYRHPKCDVIKGYGYVETVVKQMAVLMQLQDATTNRKIFYLGDPQINSLIWVNQFSRALSGTEVRRVSIFFLKFLGAVGSILKIFFPNFPFYWSRMRNMITSYPVDVSETIELTKVKPTNLKVAVEHTVIWYHEQQHNKQ